MLVPVIVHPVAELRLVYVQLSGNMRNRLRSLYHHLGGFLLELRRKLPPIPGHSIPFLSRRILLDPLSGNRGAPHVLQARRLAMVDDLLPRALPYVDHRQPAGLTARHLPAEALPRHQRGHDSPPAPAGGSGPGAALTARTALPTITASQCTAARWLASGRSSHRRAVTGSGVWGGGPLP